MDTVLQPVLEDKPVRRFRIHMDEPQVIRKVSATLANYLTQLNPHWATPTVVVCIGTDRSTGDCLGPLVGTRLQELAHGLFCVYGTLEAPVHAANLAEKIQLIRAQHTNPLIIAVDACLGKVESIGYITVGEGSLTPGAGVNKNLPAIGDIYISGIVNVGGFMEYFVLQNTRLSLVMKMAENIAAGLFHGYHQASWKMDASNKNLTCQPAF